MNKENTFTYIDGRIIDFDYWAKIRKVAYDAYTKVGFSAAQALELCKLVTP